MPFLSKVQDDNHEGKERVNYEDIIIFENVLFANANKFVYSTFTLLKILSNPSETQQISYFTKGNAGVYG